jgi:hypothetical protein
MEVAWDPTDQRNPAVMAGTYPDVRDHKESGSFVLFPLPRLACLYSIIYNPTGAPIFMSASVHNCERYANPQLKGWAPLVNNNTSIRARQSEPRE